MSSRLSLGKKLIGLSVAMSFVTVSVGGFAYWSQTKTQNKYEEVARGVLTDVISIDSAFLNFKQVRISLRTLAIEGITPAQAEQAKKETLEAINRVEEDLKKFERSDLIDGEKEKVLAIGKTWVKFKEIGSKVFEFQKINTPESRKAMAEIFFKDCPESASDFMIKVDSLRQFLTEKQTLWVEDARSEASRGNKMLALIAFGGIVLGLSASILFSIQLSRELLIISDNLETGSGQVAAASNQIASTASSLSDSSNKQAASLEETVATVEELTSMVRLNAENAKQAAILAGTTRDVATKGETEIKALISSIESISSDSKKIAEITTVIDDIAFQTNLLALNAAVEAARAGEQGKGFAVVAEAVRNLAQRSADSAKSIAALINGSVDKIESSVKQAVVGGEVLKEIVGSVKKVSDLNSEIATASEEQSNGITQIGRAMIQLDQVTQKNATASEESAASAEELSSQSRTLSEGIRNLTWVITGNR